MVSYGKSLFMLLVCFCSWDFTYQWGRAVLVFPWLAYFIWHGCSPGPSCLCVWGAGEGGWGWARETDFLFDNRVMFHCVNVSNWFLTQYLFMLYLRIAKSFEENTHTHSHTHNHTLPKTWRSWKQAKVTLPVSPGRVGRSPRGSCCRDGGLLPYSASPRHPPSTLRV